MAQTMALMNVSSACVLFHTYLINYSGCLVKVQQGPARSRKYFVNLGTYWSESERVAQDQIRTHGAVTGRTWARVFGRVGSYFGTCLATSCTCRHVFGRLRRATARVRTASANLCTCPRMSRKLGTNPAATCCARAHALARVRTCRHVPRKLPRMALVSARFGT